MVIVSVSAQQPGRTTAFTLSTPTGVYGYAPRHEGAPGRGTDGLYIVVVEDCTTVCQGVNVRCRDLTRPVEADVIPAL